jgi:hypothetical protein
LSWSRVSGAAEGQKRRTCWAQVVVMSTHNAEIREEVHSAKYLRGALTALAYSPTLDRAAMCGGNQVSSVRYR